MKTNYPPDVLNDPNRSKPAPFEYAGQWVAWNKEGTEIVAHGRELSVVHDAAIAAGHPDCVLEKVPKANTVFIGAA